MGVGSKVGDRLGSDDGFCVESLLGLRVGSAVWIETFEGSETGHMDGLIWRLSGENVDGSIMIVVMVGTIFGLGVGFKEGNLVGLLESIWIGVIVGSSK